MLLMARDFCGRWSEPQAQKSVPFPPARLESCEHEHQHLWARVCRHRRGGLLREGGASRRRRGYGAGQSGPHQLRALAYYRGGNRGASRGGRGYRDGAGDDGCTRGRGGHGAFPAVRGDAQPAERGAGPHLHSSRVRRHRRGAAREGGAARRGGAEHGASGDDSGCGDPGIGAGFGEGVRCRFWRGDEP